MYYLAGYPLSGQADYPAGYPAKLLAGYPAKSVSGTTLALYTMIWLMFTRVYGSWVMCAPRHFSK